MKTLLVLAEHPDFAEAIRSAISGEQWRILARTNLDGMAPFLDHGLIEACIADHELSSSQDFGVLTELRRKAPWCPVIVYSAAGQSEWVEEAYLRGATHVLDKPVRGRVLKALLDRVRPKPPATPSTLSARPSLPSETFKLAGAAGLPATPQALGALRNFSRLLSHSLNAKGMPQQFLALLRDILGINRAAIFLPQPFTSPGDPHVAGESHQLHAACAIGLSPDLLEHSELSSEAGIGGLLFRLGRVLWRSGEKALADGQAQKEFELLGAQVAVPMLDRETVLGVALFDTHITGEPLANWELELIFHLLEQLGLAVKNVWLHDQLAGSHEMMTDVLRELSCACIVINRDLAIPHANKMARTLFDLGDRPSDQLSFCDLPSPLGAKVNQVLKTGAQIGSFRYEPVDSPGTILSISIVPFQKPQAARPGSALLMAEDLTQREQLRRLEIETARLRLVKSMAERLTNEIRNAIVSLSTHQQLLADQWTDPEFRASLDKTLVETVKRVRRLGDQMCFLARDGLLALKTFSLPALIEEAFQDACRHEPATAPRLTWDPPAKPILITGDRAALKHALTEIMINALQAINDLKPKPPDAEITVRLQGRSNGDAFPALRIELQDNGPGFTPEAAQKAPAPFFTTKVVAVGLGLVVSRTIIEAHHGKLEIIAPRSSLGGLIRIALPLEMPSTSVYRTPS